MVMNLLRQGLRRGLGLAPPPSSSSSTHRSFADVYVPKPDTSMDHVFGDNSFRLPYNFEPPSMLKTFTMTLVTLGIFGLPVWVMAAEDHKMAGFLQQLEEAKAKKRGAPEAESS